MVAPDAVSAEASEDVEGVPEDLYTQPLTLENSRTHLTHCASDCVVCSVLDVHIAVHLLHSSHYCGPAAG